MPPFITHYIEKQKAEFESFDSFFAGLPAEDEKRAMFLYEKYIQSFLESSLTALVGELTAEILGKGPKDVPDKRNGEQMFSAEGYNIANEGWRTTIKELASKK